MMQTKLAALIVRVLQTEDGDLLNAAIVLYDQIEDTPAVAGKLATWAEYGMLSLRVMMGEGL